MLSAYLRKTMVSCKIPFKIRIPGLAPPTQMNHWTSPFGCFICYLRESDMIIKTPVLKFCSSLIFFWDFDVHKLPDSDIVCKYIILIFLWKSRKCLAKYSFQLERAFCKYPKLLKNCFGKLIYFCSYIS